MAGDGLPRTLDVLVVDDHATFADAISLAIDTQPDLHCAGTVPNAELAIEHVRSSCPDVVLLDVMLPGRRGIDAISDLRAVCPGLRVVILTANTAPAILLAAIEAGADAFLPKERRFADVLNIIRNADDATSADRATMALVLHAAPLRVAHRAPTVPELTDRESEVLVSLAGGASVKEIAQQLGISVHTCRGHVRSLLNKFNAHSQLAAVIEAARAGLLPNLRT